MGKNQDPGSGINIPDPPHCLSVFELDPELSRPGDAFADPNPGKLKLPLQGGEIHVIILNGVALKFRSCGLKRKCKTLFVRCFSYRFFGIF
jgi:hypothetical protein